MTKTTVRQPSSRSTTAPWLGYLDGTALLAWGILLLKLWWMEQLPILIHPNYVPLVIGSAFLLLIIGGLALARSYYTSKGRGAWHWGSAILLCTALISLAVNPRAFASDKAIHRGVDDMSAISARTAPASFRASNRPEQRTLLEWVRTIAAYPEPDAYTGQRAKVTGFVVRSPDLPSHVFLLTRFVITCCGADVYPVSLPVRVQTMPDNLRPDQWLEVEGVMFTLENKNQRQLAIDAQKLTPIPEPQNPYAS
jgi:uncharacterized repeat protein (TIGR03943 family)